jgi:hypothetical protein
MVDTRYSPITRKHARRAPAAVIDGLNSQAVDIGLVSRERRVDGAVGIAAAVDMIGVAIPHP